MPSESGRSSHQNIQLPRIQSPFNVPPQGFSTSRAASLQFSTLEAGGGSVASADSMGNSIVFPANNAPPSEIIHGKTDARNRMQFQESIDEEDSDEYRDSSSNNITIDYNRSLRSKASERHDS